MAEFWVGAELFGLGVNEPVDLARRGRIITSNVVIDIIKIEPSLDTPDNLHSLESGFASGTGVGLPLARSST